MRFLLTTLLLGGLWLMAAPAPTTADLQTRLDQLEKQLQAQNELLIVKTEGKVESVEKQMARQDERIRDMDQNFNKWITSFGLFLAAASVLIAVYVSDSAKKTEAAAGKITREEIQKWIDKEAPQHLDGLVEQPIREATERALGEIRQKSDELLTKIAERSDEQYRRGEEQINTLDQLAVRQKTPESKANLARAENTDESKRTFDDWLNISASYYWQGNFDNAMWAVEKMRERATNDLEKVKTLLLETEICFSGFNDDQKGIEVSYGIISKYGDQTEMEMIQWVALAMFNLGGALKRQGRAEEAIKVYREMIEKYQKYTEEKIVEWVAKAMINLGALYIEENEAEYAIQTYRALINQYEKRTEVAIVKEVVSAMSNLGVAFGRQGNIEGEIHTYHNLINKYGKRTESSIVEEVARAMFNLGVAMVQQRKLEAAAQTYRNMIDRYGNYSEAGIVVQVAKAMFNLGDTLKQQGHPEEAIQTYHGLITKYGERPEVGIVEVVGRARKHLGDLESKA